MSRNLSPTRQGWAIIVLSAAVLALAGCGRKGPLDLPPNAASAQAKAWLKRLEKERKLG